MEFYLLAAAALLGVAAIAVRDIVRSGKKLRNNIQEQFGSVPDRTEEPPFDEIARYWNYKNDFQHPDGCIDQTTWNDLDMDEVFKRMNICRSAVGEQYLYAALHQPQYSWEVLDSRARLMEYLDANPQRRLELQVLLSGLKKSDYSGLPSLLYGITVKEPLKYSWVCRVLRVLPFVSAGIAVFNLPTGIACVLLSMAVNTAVNYFLVRGIQSDLTAMKSLSALFGCCQKILKQRDADFTFFTQPMQSALRQLNDVGGALSGIAQPVFGDMGAIMDCVRAVLLSDPLDYSRVVRKLSGHMEAFNSLFGSVGELELAIAVLSFRKSLPYWCVPRFTQSKTIGLDEVCHPLLSSPVANTLAVSKSCIITGSNASGKSTFIKAVAVNGILAQTIYTCSARQYRTRFAQIISSMAVRDNITAGDSYFITEIKSLKRVLDKTDSGFPCICFIDEILKGTNTIERIAASAAILRDLGEKDCVCLVASHDIELTELLKDSYDNYHFSEQITDDGIGFDYTIKDGAAQTRNAIKLLSYMDFNEEIICTAENLVEEFVNNKKWEMI